MPDQEPDAPDEALFHFNGVNGETGDYSLPPVSGAQLSEHILGEEKPENLGDLRKRRELSEDGEHRGLKEGLDPKRLDEAGWGIIFTHDADPAIREALGPLLALRQGQAGERFRVYAGGEGYRPGDSKSAWLARAPRKAGPGPADPDKVPYYLLICASPEQIPYRFQSQLDVQYAVGRIHFDTIDEYAHYAASVVAAEGGTLRLPRGMGFLGVANPLDRATNLSAKQLVAPLREQLAGEFPDWTFGAAMGAEATKARLARMLGGEETPALLFTASHGMDFPLNSPRQLRHQGALLCQDWPGPAHRGAIPEDFYFCGDDLDSDTNLQGLIAFFFACYGAGTPEMDEFYKQASKERSRIAPRPFMAGLPTRMLGLPQGGALAVIGHVERAWTYSFSWQKAGAQTEVFRSTLHRLIEGHPVGSALEFFNERYAELSTVLADELEEIEWKKQFDPNELAGLWTANNDARGYALIGDPAVRLPVAAADEAPGERRPLEIRPTAPATASRGEMAPEVVPAEPADRAEMGPEPEAGASHAANLGDGLSISTYLAKEPETGANKSLVARTRISAAGDIETQVADRYAERAELLTLHQAMVEQALRNRPGD